VALRKRPRVAIYRIRGRRWRACGFVIQVVQRCGWRRALPQFVAAAINEGGARLLRTRRARVRRRERATCPLQREQLRLIRPSSSGRIGLLGTFAADGCNLRVDLPHNDLISTPTFGSHPRFLEPGGHLVAELLKSALAPLYRPGCGQCRSWECLK
jgi:hypothetical protein